MRPERQIPYSRMHQVEKASEKPKIGSNGMPKSRRLSSSRAIDEAIEGD